MKNMKYEKPIMDVVELDATVITELSAVGSDENPGNTPPSIGEM